MKTEAEEADTTLTRESVRLGTDRAASLPERQCNMTTETLPQRCLAMGGGEPAEITHDDAKQDDLHVTGFHQCDFHPFFFFSYLYFHV